MNRTLAVTIATLFAASLGTASLAATTVEATRVAKATPAQTPTPDTIYSAAKTKAKSEYKAAQAECNKGAAEKKAACLKQAKAEYKKANSDALTAYNKSQAQKSLSKS